LLNLYRRHTAKCTKGYAQHDRKASNCKCIVYAEGKLKSDSPYIKESTGTRSLEQARRIVVAAELRGFWDRNLSYENVEPAGRVSEIAPTLPGQSPGGKSVSEVVREFLKEAVSPKGRNLSVSTHSKYKTLLKRLEQFCGERGFQTLREIDLEVLRSFRNSWPTGSRATINNVQRLRTFYRFCLGNKWVDENIAADLQCPKKIKPTQKLPFTEEEFHRIMQAVATVDWDEQQTVTRSELECFILTMRYSGLRISDVALLRMDRIQGNQLGLYQTKPGEWVMVPLPHWLLHLLRKTRQTNGYLFCRGSKRLETATDLWRRRIQKVFAAAGVTGTPHRFRHTFAVDLLSKGVDIKHVSMLLGHSSVTITERHYAAWVKSRQDALTADVERAYGSRSGLSVVNS
jgi:integrase/recombinase XerD